MGFFKDVGRSFDREIRRTGRRIGDETERIGEDLGLKVPDLPELPPVPQEEARRFS